MSAPSLAAQESPPSAAGHELPPDSSKAEPVDEPNAPQAEADPPGYFRIPGTRTWIRVAASPYIDLIRDFDPIGSVDDFIPSTIPVGAERDTVSGGRTDFSFRQTDVQLFSRTEAGDGRIDTRIKVNFFGGTADDPALQLYLAYFNLVGLVAGGDLTAGLAFSTFTDTVSLPQTLDYQGPNGAIWDRKPLVRWNRSFGEWSTFVSLEEPRPDIEGGEGVTRLPDAGLALAWDPQRAHLWFGVMLRQLLAREGTDPVASSFGWGISAAARLDVTEEGDNFRYELTYGSGIGRYLNDAVTDAVLNPLTDDLENIRQLGGYAAYQRWWSDRLRSNAVYSHVRVYAPPTDPPDALGQAQYVAVDLIWNPLGGLEGGIELLWGRRANQNDESATATRLQASAKYAF